MKKVIIKIDGMKCGMCESHVCKELKNAISPIKIKASYKTKEVIFIIDDENKIKAAASTLESLGYKIISIETKDYEKKGLFHKL